MRNDSDGCNTVVWDAAPVDFIPKDLTHTDSADPSKTAEGSIHTTEDEVYACIVNYCKKTDHSMSYAHFL